MLKTNVAHEPCQIPWLTWVMSHVLLSSCNRGTSINAFRKTQRVWIFYLSKNIHIDFKALTYSRTPHFICRHQRCHPWCLFKSYNLEFKYKLKKSGFLWFISSEFSEQVSVKKVHFGTPDPWSLHLSGKWSQHWGSAPGKLAKNCFLLFKHSCLRQQPNLQNELRGRRIKKYQNLCLSGTSSQLRKRYFEALVFAPECW